MILVITMLMRSCFGSVGAAKLCGNGSTLGISSFYGTTYVFF